ncbi:DUF599 family protein [uncultured Cohaesibacter sp.]|uniref:DUF599 domain-containing protein n=1 Tax=uncultured Cohaesibacter sp. TaxID=1002546 RepID=UPI0029C89139|nr:DUF599 family protein [uncultured Cohaesibacter sp.]
MIPFSLLDYVALFWYITFWLCFSWVVDHSRLKHHNLSHLMNGHRLRWMRNMSTRDLRMVDTAIISGLQNGTAFFASTSLLAIGGGFAMLNSTERAIQLFSDLSIPVETTRALWEVKVLFLILIYVYAFFKFGWAYRLFNYSSILIGALPYAKTADEQELEIAIRQAAEFNSLAGKHFNLGLRSFFFSLALFGWFVHPGLLIVTTTFVGLVLIRRQYFSRSQTLSMHLLPEKE